MVDVINRSACVLISDNGQVVRGGSVGAQSRSTEVRKRIVRARFLSDFEAEGARILVAEAFVDRGGWQSRIHFPDTGHIEEAGLLDLHLLAKW